MKKIIFALSALIVCSSLFSMTINAEPTDKQIKMAKNAAVKKARELEKAGWKMSSSMTMTEALQDFYLKLERYGGNCKEFSPVIEHRQSIDGASIEARNSAHAAFTQDAKSVTTGKASSMTDVANNIDIQKFNVLFETEMIAEMSGSLVQSFIIFKQNDQDKNLKDVQIFYTYKFDELKYGNQYEQQLKKALEQAN